MSYEKIYYRTENWNEFVNKAQKEFPNVLRKSINRQYNRIKKRLGPQEELRKNYTRKYEYEFSYTNSRDEFVKECRRRYRGVTKSNLIKRYYDVRKRVEAERKRELEIIDKPVPEVEPEIILPNEKEEIDFDDLIPINEVKEPPTLKMIQIKDMKRYGYKLTDGFLKQYGFNRFEINWLKYNKII